MVVYAGTKQDRLLEVIEIILQQLKELKTEPVTDAELALAREHLKGNLLLSLESTDNRMTKLAKNEIYFGRQVAIAEIIAGLDRVTPSDLIDLGDELFRDDCLTLELLGKLGSLSIPPYSISL